MLGNRPLLPTRWPLAVPDSRVEFALRHLGVAAIRGAFTSLDGSVRADAGNALRELHVRVDAHSLATGSATRDARLRELGVFGSDLHPTLLFRSDWSYEKGRGREGMQGSLTMHGQTHVVELIATPGTVTADADGGGRRIYATLVTGAIDRRAWGVAVHPLLEVGGVLLGHEVHVAIHVRARVDDG
jgi:polyisoprenoid-binding protein YceI